MTTADAVGFPQGKSALCADQLASVLHIEGQNIRPFHFSAGGDAPAAGNTLVMISYDEGMILHHREIWPVMGWFFEIDLVIGSH